MLEEKMFGGVLVLVGGMFVLYIISKIFRINERTFLNLLIVWFISFAGIQYWLTSNWPVEKYDKKLSESQLHAMTTDQQLSGSFTGWFLHQYGSIGESYVYSFWEKFNGGYHHSTIDGSDYWVTVYEDATPETATLKSYGRYEDPVDDYPWAFWTIIGPQEGLKPGKWYDFHVPPGTVVTGFTAS